MTADANGTASVDLIASQPSIKIISMLGNKAALQEEANKVLGRDPKSMSLTVYDRAASFRLENLRSSPMALVLLSSQVASVDQPETLPSEKICFAAICENG